MGKMPEVTTEELWNHYASGMSTVKIARMYSCSPWAINRRFRVAKLPIRTRREAGEWQDNHLTRISVFNQKRALLDILDDLYVGHPYSMQTTLDELQESVDLFET